MLDLLDRSVHLVPSASSQLASRSKVYQTILFSPWLIPGTAAIYTPHDLLIHITEYNRFNHQKVIVKHDRKNGGIGIFLYSGIEDVYSQAANGMLPLPFVLQPFILKEIDLRVIIIGDYVEAYQRINPHNFRNNLHCGGKSIPFTLSAEMLKICKNVMDRGNFPYAHIDLMITEEKQIYLNEINLRGGLHGAEITTEEYKKRIQTIEEGLVQSLR